MHICYKILICVILVPGWHEHLNAQATLQTVSKSVTKTIPISAETLFSVVTEKASVVISGWSNNYIEARLTFSASHPDKNTAIRELAYMQYAITREKDLIELRNAFLLPPATDHIQSKLEVKMELMVPFTSRLQTTSKYGNIKMMNISGKTNVSVSFGDIILTTILGELTINAEYSEIRGTGINVSSLHCTNEQSKIIMGLEGGHYFFNSKHSDLDLDIKHLKGLSVQANRTDITIRPEKPGVFNYNLINNEGAVYLPDKYAPGVIKKGKQTVFVVKDIISGPLIHITNTFNAITIK